MQEKMENNNDFSIIIPAAGIGKRMKSYGPKALIRLVDNNVLARQLSILQSIYPKNDIVIVAGFEDNKIKEFVNNWKNERIVGSRDVKVITNKRYLETNVAKSIAMATEYCDKEDYLIVYGDLVFTPETFSDINWQRSGVLLDNNKQFDKLEAGVIINQNSQISKFCYDSDIKWAQVAYLKKEHMAMFLELMDSPVRSKYFTFEIFNLMLEQMNFKPYYNETGKIVELDYSEDIQAAKKLVKGEI